MVIKRLLKGLVMFGISLAFMFVYPGYANFDDFQANLVKYLTKFLPEPISHLIGALVFLGVIILFVKGFYYIINCNLVNPIFEGKRVQGSYDYSLGEFRNLDAVMSFRESRLNALPQQEASEEYLKTAALDGLYSNKGVSKGVYKTYEYLDSKLAGMSPADGYEYLKNNF